MVNFQILHMILETIGLVKQTRARIKRQLVLGIGKDQQDGAGPSGTSNDPMDLSG
jgi:hypothetical protein